MKWPDFNRVRVDHVTHGLQNDRSKSSGILRSLYSLLFCYYSLLVFVKIARFGYRHYYKSFVTVCTYKLVPSALPALRLCGNVVLGSCDTQTIPQSKIWGCFHSHFSAFAAGYYDIFQSPHLILSAFLSCQMDTRLVWRRTCAKRRCLFSLLRWQIDRHHKTKFCVPREHHASTYRFCNGFQKRCLSLLLDKILTLLRPLPNFKSRRAG